MPLPGYISRKHLLGMGYMFFISSLLSCSGDEKELPSNINNEEIITLNLSIDSDSGTRVTKEGSEVENYIDFKNRDFQILIYDGDGNFKKELDNSGSSSEIKVLSEDDAYDLELNLNSAEIGSGKIQVMLIANCKSFAGSSYSKFDSKEKIWEGAYTFALPNLNEDLPSLNEDYSWYPTFSEDEDNESRLIPMVGLTIGNLMDSETKDGKLFLPLKINMTRALAKITLQVSDDLYDAGYDLDEANITYYNSVGSFLPYIGENENQIAENGDIIISKPSCPNQERVEKPLLFSNVGKPEGKKLLVAYIPEMDNSNLTVKDKKRPKIDISLKNIKNNQSLEGVRFIELNYYLTADETPAFDNGLFDILRNSWLDYTLSDIIKEDSDFKFSIDFTVCPWTEGNTSIRFE